LGSTFFYIYAVRLPSRHRVNSFYRRDRSYRSSSSSTCR